MPFQLFRAISCSYQLVGAWHLSHMHPWSLQRVGIMHRLTKLERH